MFIDLQIQRLRPSSEDAPAEQRRGGGGEYEIHVVTADIQVFQLQAKQKKQQKTVKKWEKNNKKKEEINKTKHFLRALPLNKVADNSYNNSNNNSDDDNELAWNPPSGQEMLPKSPVPLPPFPVALDCVTGCPAMRAFCLSSC